MFKIVLPCVCVCVGGGANCCDLQTSVMRWPRPEFGCKATEKNSSFIFMLFGCVFS